MRKACLGLALAIVSLSCSTGALGKEATAASSNGKPQSLSDQQSDDAKSKAMAALKKAAEKKRYAFIFFYKQDDAQTEKTRRVFDEAMKKFAEKADPVVVNVADRDEKAAVEKFDVSKAPMPLVLAIAPNGAITGGFPKEVDEARLNKAFVSPVMADCLRNLQDHKLVFLCIQNDTTKNNESAMRGVDDFKADSRFAEDTRAITLDPSRPEEAKTLQNLQVDPKTTEAVTLFIAPPGSIVGKYNGATTKDQLVKALQSRMTACKPGSGCCPKK